MLVLVPAMHRRCRMRGSLLPHQLVVHAVSLLTIWVGCPFDTNRNRRGPLRTEAESDHQ